jgi:hypothetical protein
MNERIEELTSLCRIETYGVNGELLYEGFDEQKFAKLIIEECIKQVNKDHRPGGRESWDRSLDNAIRNIKEHFGI